MSTVASPKQSALKRSASPASVRDVRTLQRAIGNRATGGALRGLSERRLQRYTVVGQLNPLAPAAGGYQIPGVNPEFEAQTVAAPNINAPAAAVPAQVRVSNDGNMALEDSNLAGRQPKVFYATQSVVTNANTRLAAVGSDYELFIDRPNALRVTLPGQPARDLARVLPQVRATGGHEGLALTVGQDCVAVAKAVMKHEDTNRQPRTARNLPDVTWPEFRVARYMATFVTQQIANNATIGAAFWTWWGSAHKPARAEFVNGLQADNATLTAIATDYGNLQLNHPALAGQIAQDLGVNEHALPNVGEAYETYRIGPGGGVPQTQPGGPAGIIRNFWGQHIAGVVAASGNDRVTLENYARSHEIGGMQANAPHYYFQMYGTGVGQSWHEAWTTGAVAAGLPPVGNAAGPALTTVVRSAPRSWFSGVWG